MPHYMLQWSFTPAQAKAMTENPQDREGPARQVIEGFGGRLVCYFFMLGERDGVAIVEFPDNESAVACSMRVGSSGAFAAFETHALLTSAEAQRAMQKVKSAGVAYRPPSG
ncbi:GYD domain-containing protein [Roseomonas eburnea]|uniref:GYD domain-containing protein n=1 Tax=Neoroseomonas eburnea TaxID=1346889 RepID=A0A9X9XA09_9PROT|nr:GYD domain-containing protein [Neoroseomonas eburnea]MBR0680545.1 GYD domain-containing protein [Neoroseomonas eburnea]